MKKETVAIQIEAEKLRAVKRYMEKKEADLEQELCDSLQKLYEKYVPAPVRDYIDEGGDDTPGAPSKAKKQREKIQTATPTAEKPPLANS